MSQVTIIIPTLNRHNLLLRAIDYYQHFDCNILVADSSAIKENCKFPDNFIYKHLPGIGYAKKQLEAAKDVTTPYVCLVADDDYLLESSLKEGVNFLNANLDYVSAQGRYLGFELIENQVIFSTKYGRTESNYAVEAEDRFSRLAEAFNPCMHHLYAIHRTNLFIKSFQLPAESSICHETLWKDLALTEFTQPLVPMCYGKHKVLPVLWMVRDTYQFDLARYQKRLKVVSVVSIYKRINCIINEIENFLRSEECLLLKKNFGAIVSELVSSKESEKLFNVAFKSLIKSFINERNKMIIKKIIKSFVPTWVLSGYIKRKKNRHMGGVETTPSAKDALDKVRLSILTFPKCYDR